MSEYKKVYNQIPRSSALCFIFTFFLLHVVDSLSLNSVGNMKKISNNKPMNIDSKWKYREDDGAYFPVIEGFPQGLPARVAFSKSSKPTLSPSEGSLTNKHILDDESPENFDSTIKLSNRSAKKHSKAKRRHRHGKKKNRSRRRRSHRNGRVRIEHPISACNSISEWVQMNQSVTTWGHTVTVLPYIWVDDRRIDQYIYETQCLDSRQPCTGIDNRLFRSECVTKKIYSYAFVRNEFGDESWTTIEIKGSCNCKLFPKHRARPRNILDHLINENAD